MNTLTDLPLIPNRHCGQCFACCKILNIYSDTLNKPADVLCPHYQHQHGCTIYDARPTPCRQWYCVWRFDKHLPDDFSPDKINIAFCLETSPREPDKMVIVGRAYEADHTMAFNTDNAKRAFELLMDAGHEVWLSSGVLKAPIMRGQPLPRFDLPTRITPTDKKNQLSRNAACSCGSGLRYKACCGKMS